MKQRQESIRAWLESEPAKSCLKISAIERLSGIKGHAISDFLSGRKYRNLTEVQQRKIIEVIEKLGYESKD